VFSGFATPITSLFFPKEHGGEAFSYVVRYAVVYLPLAYVQLIGHFLHAYLRSLGRITTVLAISLVGSAVRWGATVLLVPVMHIEGAFLGQVVGWAADAAVSVLLFLCLYRTDAQLQRLMDNMHMGGGK
jgi:Na+-driven multidrug efflux pump